MPLENDDTVAAADVVCNLGRVAFVVHEQKLEFPDIADEEFLQAVGKEMSCPLVASVTDLSRPDL